MGVRLLRQVEFVEGAAVPRDPGEHAGRLAQADRATGADVHDALRGGQRGRVDGARDVADVHEVPLHPESAELELAVAGLHGAPHGLGEPAERGAAGVPGPTGEKIRSTTASSPEPSTSSVAASLLTPYGPPGLGTASSAVDDPGWLGPYSAAQPSWTSRAPQPLRRSDSQMVATATVLCRVSSRAPPRWRPRS